MDKSLHQNHLALFLFYNTIHVLALSKYPTLHWRGQFFGILSIKRWHPHPFFCTRYTILVQCLQHSEGFISLWLGKFLKLQDILKQLYSLHCYSWIPKAMELTTKRKSNLMLAYRATDSNNKITLKRNHVCQAKQSQYVLQWLWWAKYIYTFWVLI